MVNLKDLEAIILKKPKNLPILGNKPFVIIGVGGIHTAKDALDKLEVGADLIQLFTGFIYEGPKLLQEINKAINQKNINSKSIFLHTFTKILNYLSEVISALYFIYYCFLSHNSSFLFM